MTKTILVFGSSGQVAQAIAALRADVEGVDLVFAGREVCDLSVADPGALIERLRPAAIVNASAHTAVDKAESEPDAAMRLNRDAPGAMARAAAKLGAPFVHISTDYVFDGTKSDPYVETDPTGPLGVYGASKLEGEAQIRQAGGRWSIFRTAWVVSPGGANFVNTMRRLGAERDLIRVVDDQYGRPTLAADIAEVCLLAARGSLDERPALQGLFHLAGADDASWADLAEYVFEDLKRRTGRRPRLERITTADYPTPARRPANSRLDTSKLQAAIDWTPRPWRETVDACLQP